MRLKKVLFVFVIVFSAVILFTFPVMGRMSTINPEIAEKLRAIGRSLDRDAIEAINKLYAPLLAKAPKDGVKVTRDEKYGSHERNRLDVYEPIDHPTTPMPILIFVHGGGFVRGDKSDYENIGFYFARNGVLTVLMSYRLAPEYKWPSGAEDIAGAIKWIRLNGEKFGGDINRIFIMGHSAGASHVATYVFFEDFQLKDGDGVLGAILMAGPAYDTSQLNKMIDLSYFGEDESKYPSMSVINNVDGRKIPVFIEFGEFDIPNLEYQSVALFNALYKRDNACSTIKQVINHNHFSEVLQFNTGDESLGPDILTFIESKN